jgi:hypothetical protein
MATANGARAQTMPIGLEVSARLGPSTGQRFALKWPDHMPSCTAYRFSHHESPIKTRTKASAKSIQFWTGMPPKIVNCLKSQLLIEAPQNARLQSSADTGLTCRAKRGRRSRVVRRPKVGGRKPQEGGNRSPSKAGILHACSGPRRPLD